jgi:hypothetical protein
MIDAQVFTASAEAPVLFSSAMIVFLNGFRLPWQQKGSALGILRGARSGTSSNLRTKFHPARACEGATLRHLWADVPDVLAPQAHSESGVS